MLRRAATGSWVIVGVTAHTTFGQGQITQTHEAMNGFANVSMIMPWITQTLEEAKDPVQCKRISGDDMSSPSVSAPSTPSPTSPSTPSSPDSPASVTNLSLKPSSAASPASVTNFSLKPISATSPHTSNSSISDSSLASPEGTSPSCQTPSLAGKDYTGGQSVTRTGAACQR